MPRPFGQHFLIRGSVLKRIADRVFAQKAETVVEIGPGRGALTQLLVSQAQRVVAVEIDPVLVHYLQEKLRGEPRFEVIESDILKTDLTQWGPVTVAGNLPYYITSPIIEHVLRLGPLLSKAVFLVQKEVAERITAVPGTREYGYLSVLSQVSTEARYVMTVPPDAFRPPPKVFSGVVELIPRAASIVPNPAPFLRFAGLCFAHKRKTLRNNLIEAYPTEKVESQPEAKLRAEQLGVEQLADLYNRLSG